MDWLAMNNASLECRDRKLSFTSLLGERVTTTGTRGDPKLHLVNATKLLKGYHKGQMIYAVKMNPSDKPHPPNEPEWLHEYVDVFPEELTQLPPQREVDHAIELVP